MKQIVQNLRSGVLELLEVPCPQAARGHLLIRSRASLISAGTERSLVEFGKANLLAKARQNPERVQQVLAKMKADGLLPTLEAVFNRLDEPLPLGYCNAGVVVAVGAGVTEFAVGDRVASNGHHAEWVHVPRRLCALIPNRVADDEAAFAVLGAIALQGVRLLEPQLSETVVVFGLGLVGLIAVQMLVASGARVIGIDLDAERLRLAESFGAQTINPRDAADPVAVALGFTQGKGVDGVLITASAKHDTIMSQAAQMSRKRGRLILVGVVDLGLNRAEFYEKELVFQVSCSYGPGRYDPSYEEQGNDYPLGFVRWTEQRNIEAVLDLIARGRLDVSRLISHRIDFEQALQAYELLSSGQSQMGVVLTYPPPDPEFDPARNIAVAAAGTTESAGSERVQSAATASFTPRADRAVVGVIGAGGFTKGVLLPALIKTNAVLHTIASAGGLSAAHAARRFGFQNSSTDYRALLANPQINAVVITTRHNQHARMVVEALEAGKHVFVEKPLAIDREGLDHVAEAYHRAAGQELMVGFNRRFAPFIVRMKQLLQGRVGPLCINMLVNAGSIPADHWVHDPEVGGGRLIGEACHWIDLLSFLAGSPVVQAHADHVGRQVAVAPLGDHCSIALTFADGSIGSVHYFANGHRSFPKERLTVFADGKVLEMDNYRRLLGFGFAAFGRAKAFRQDKGHAAECRQWVERIVSGGPPLIPFAQLYNVTEASFRCVPGSVESSEPSSPVCSRVAQ